MATYNYIILRNSTEELGKRYKAIAMRAPTARTDTIDYTLAGTIDKASGPILDRYSYTLRVPQDSEIAGENYGTMEDLKELFSLNYPQGSPNDVITLIDHYGTSHSCYFMNELNPEPLTTMLEGSNAWHIVQIDLHVIPGTEESS